MNTSSFISEKSGYGIKKGALQQTLFPFFVGLQPFQAMFYMYFPHLIAICQLWVNKRIVEAE